MNEWMDDNLTTHTYPLVALDFKILEIKNSNLPLLYLLINTSIK
jgi:hypothetical protein